MPLTSIIFRLVRADWPSRLAAKTVERGFSTIARDQFLVVLVVRIDGDLQDSRPILQVEIAVLGVVGVLIHQFVEIRLHLVVDLFLAVGVEPFWRPSHRVIIRMDKQIFEQRRKLVLKAGKERVLANRHPWIFAGAIAQESGPPEAALADLIDQNGGALASGFYSPHSQIRLRAMTFGGDALTAELLESRISAAIARRHPILDHVTNA